MGQIKLLKINQTNINAVNQIVNLNEENYVKQDKYTFLLKALEVYNQKEFTEDEIVTDIIKVMLPSDEEKAKKQWQEGILWNDEIYIAWFATVGGMKQEDNNKKNPSKCEVLFIKNSLGDFKIFFEDIISLGKFKTLEDKELYVNKEILSRFSLATSTLLTEIEMPNIIILPQANLKGFKRTYKAVDPKEVENENGEKQIKYSMYEYEFDTDKLDENGKAIDKIDIFDGGAIATAKVFKQIGESLDKKRYDIDFAVIRGYGNGIKGLITKFDIIGYLDVMYKEDTDYCKKENDKYYLLDMYGEWREVTDNTLLLNESMVKLSDKFDNMDEYDTLLNKCNTEEHIDVYNLLTKLYITKVNKSEKDLTEYRSLCYQLFNALALTEKEYKLLAEQDYKVFSKLIAPFDYIKESDDEAENLNENERFKVNIDTINLFFKHCINVIVDDDEATEEEKQQELNEIQEIKTVVDKCAILVNLNEENVKLDYVKKQIGSLVEKKIRQMASGKITVKAAYNYIAIDPISYMNFAMTREQGDNGLKAGQFYNRKCNNGDIRTIYRNPLMAFSEIHNIEFVRNTFFDNWLCKTSELIYFNQKSDIYGQIGSGDSDGDAVTVIDSEIIRRGVIETDKPFLFTADGKKVPYKYNDEGRFYCTYRPSGNLIGSIALLATSVNTESQTLKTYYREDKDKFYSFNEITKILIDKDKHGIKGVKSLEEQIKITKEAIEKLIDNGKLQYTSNVDAEIIRNKIKQRFYANEQKIYSLLYCSSLTIDTPKTMNIIDPSMYTREVEQQYWNREDDNRIFKPYFLQFKKSAKDIKYSKKDWYSSYQKSFMDKFAKEVQDKLLERIEKRKKKFTDKHEMLQKQLENDKYNKDTAYDCYDALTVIYSEFVQAKDKAYKFKKSDYKKYRKLLKENDIATLEKVEELKDKADIYSIAIALSKLDHVSEDFLINSFIDCFIKVDTLKPSKKAIYSEDADGTIEFMYKHYSKKFELMNYSDEVAAQLDLKQKEQLGLIQELRFMVADNVPEGEKEQTIIDITKKIKESLIDNNEFYELDITEEGLSKIGIKSADPKYTKELNKILENGNRIINIAGFMRKKKTDELAISKKSFGIYINCY